MRSENFRVRLQEHVDELRAEVEQLELLLREGEWEVDPASLRYEIATVNQRVREIYATQSAAWALEERALEERPPVA